MFGMGGMLAARHSAVVSLYTGVYAPVEFGTSKEFRLRIPASALVSLTSIASIKLAVQGVFSGVFRIAQCHPNNTGVGSTMEYTGPVYTVAASNAEPYPVTAVDLPVSSGLILMMSLGSGNQSTLERADNAGPWETHVYGVGPLSANPGGIVADRGFRTPAVSSAWFYS